MSFLERGPHVGGTNSIEGQSAVGEPSPINSETMLSGGQAEGAAVEGLQAGTQITVDSTVSKRRFRSGIPQVAKNMWHRGNLEGLTTAVGIDILSTAYFWAVIPALTAIINTAASLTDFQLAAAAAAAAAGRVIYKSLGRDAEALDKKHFATNSFSTSAYGITGHPLISAELGHLAGISAVAFGNPIGILSVLNGDASLFKVNVMAAAIAAPSWYLFFNSRIARGEFDGILNTVKKERHVLVEKIKRKIGR